MYSLLFFIHCSLQFLDVMTLVSVLFSFEVCVVLKDQGDFEPCEIDDKLILDLPDVHRSRDEMRLSRAVTA